MINIAVKRGLKLNEDKKKSGKPVTRVRANRIIRTREAGEGNNLVMKAGRERERERMNDGRAGGIDHNLQSYNARVPN